MKIISTSLEKVKILEYEFNTDNRGLSYPLYCKIELEKEEIYFNYIEERIYCSTQKKEKIML